MSLDESATQRRIAELVDPHAHYTAQLEESIFRNEALDLLRRLKVYADRSASPIAHELCVEACEFIAKHTKKEAA